MQNIYFCGAHKDIKVAHPSLFNYSSNLAQAEDNYQAASDGIYLSPEELQALEYSNTNFKGGWSSNAFTFGMILVSLLTLQPLDSLYNYQTCELYTEEL